MSETRQILILTWEYKSQPKDSNPFDYTQSDWELHTALQNHLDKSTVIEEIYRFRHNLAATDKGYFATFFKDAMPSEFVHLLTLLQPNETHSQ